MLMHPMDGEKRVNWTCTYENEDTFISPSYWQFAVTYIKVWLGNGFEGRFIHTVGPDPQHIQGPTECPQPIGWARHCQVSAPLLMSSLRHFFDLSSLSPHGFFSCGNPEWWNPECFFFYFCIFHSPHSSSSSRLIIPSLLLPLLLTVHLLQP